MEIGDGMRSELLGDERRQQKGTDLFRLFLDSCI